MDSLEMRPYIDNAVKEERQAVWKYLNEYCSDGHYLEKPRTRRYQCRLCMLALSKRLRQGRAPTASGEWE